jgi:hypothetical protein
MHDLRQTIAIIAVRTPSPATKEKRQLLTQCREGESRSNHLRLVRRRSTP